MTTEEHIEYIQLLPLTDDQVELLEEAGKPILDDVIDFVEIRFPNWQAGIGSWAAEYLLDTIRLYEDIYENANTSEITRTV
jgi:hypothetical protein